MTRIFLHLDRPREEGSLIMVGEGEGREGEGDISAGRGSGAGLQGALAAERHMSPGGWYLTVAKC